ncbi:Protein YOP1 [Verticillium dahliae VDG1]|nr:Protein YOP1 [Verticillium dahliae VDG1]
MASPSENKENYLLSYEGHWAAVRTTFTPRSLSEVPQVFYVCQSKILSCCENLSTDYICHQIDRFIVSKFPAGAWVRGNQHIFRSDACSETNCFQKAQESFDSLHSELTETVRTKAKRKPKKRPRTEDDLNSTTSTSPPGRGGLPLHDDGISDKNDETDTDITMATKIANKLLRGIVALRLGHVAPAYQRLSYDSQFIQITVEKKTADIGQLGVDLWRLSEETERKAVNTAWRDRLLSSCCRIYCNANNLRPPGTDPDPEREKTQKRHGDAIAMLCWVVNDLYEWRKSLALVLFPALCG